MTREQKKNWKFGSKLVGSLVLTGIGIKVVGGSFLSGPPIPGNIVIGVLCAFAARKTIS